MKNSIGKIVLKIHVELTYEAQSPCDVLLQLQVAQLPRQVITSEQIDISPSQIQSRTPADDNIGERIWLHAEGEFTCAYRADVAINQQPTDIGKLNQHELPDISGDVVKYLMASRYCHLEKIEDDILAKFEGVSGGRKVLAMSDWIAENFTYDSGASNAFTNAHDSLATKAGVCRDYAHVLIAMARTSGIPARMVSAYALNVTPQDFHALIQVYLEGDWHLVDPTGMSKPEETAIIGVGRDAADISFLTSYGFVTMKSQQVQVEQLDV